VWGLTYQMCSKNASEWNSHKKNPQHFLGFSWKGSCTHLNCAISIVSFWKTVSLFLLLLMTHSWGRESISEIQNFTSSNSLNICFWMFSPEDKNRRSFWNLSTQCWVIEYWRCLIWSL
jgi:hypothetical protein